MKRKSTRWKNIPHALTFQHVDALLAAQMFGLLIWYFIVPRSVFMQADSLSYLQFSFSWPDVLTQFRTPGYPLFLSLVRWQSPALTSLPFLQLTIHAVAVMMFAVGLRFVGFSPFFVLLTASPLFYARTVMALHPAILSDSLAVSLYLMALSALFFCVRQSVSKAALIALAILSFLTLWVRPAFLFLLVAFPFFGWGIAKAWALRNYVSGNFAKEVAVHIAAACAAIPIAYSALRWLIVGHLGFVSVGGVALSGMAAQFVEPALMSQLSMEMQPLAQHILLEQQRLKLVHTSAQGQRILSVDEIEVNYNTYVYDILLPYLRAQHLSDSQAARYLSQFSREVLKHQWRSYVLLSVIAFRKALMYFPNPFLLFFMAIVVPLTYIAGKIIGTDGSVEAESDREFYVSIIAILWTGHFLLSLGMAMVVQPPLPRYVHVAHLFTPSLMWTALVVNSLRIISKR